MCRLHRPTVLLVLSGLAACPAPEPEVTCEHDGHSYQIGDQFTAADGCNECLCGANGTVTCTYQPCADGGPGDDAATPQDAGNIDRASSDRALPDHPGQDLTGRDRAAPRDAGVWDRGGSGNEVVAFPGASCEVESVNGAPPDGPPAPGDQIVVTAQTLPAPTAGAAVQQVRWSLVLTPPGSRTALRAADGMRTGLGRAATGSNRLDPSQGPDLAGTYVLRAAITDDQGGTAEHDCALEIRPRAALYIELSWDRRAYNTDLRLAREVPGEGYCAVGVIPHVLDGVARSCSDAADTCYFGNCLRTSSERPDWDGDGDPGTAGDPRLLADNSVGFGPEVIEIEAPLPGDYLVSAHVWSGDALPTQARATIWVHGQLWAFAEEPLGLQEWWEPFVVQWPSSAGGEVCAGPPSSATPYCEVASRCTPSCPTCPANRPCGPGATCDDSLDRCVAAASACLSDSACGAGLVCAWSSDVCVEPVCGPGAPCETEGEECGADIGLCVPSAAECDETDEPNNTLDTATALRSPIHSDVLCRGDVDLVRFSGSADAELRVSVALDLENGARESGVTVALLDADGELIDTAAADLNGRARLVTTVSQAGSFYVRIDGVLATPISIPYTVQVSECPPEPGEPNDDLDHATGPPLTPETHSAVLCGPTDADFYQVTVRALLRARLVVRFAPEQGQVNGALLDLDGRVLMYGQGGGDSVMLRHNGSDVDQPIVLRVDRDWWEGDTEAQGYSVELSYVEIPSCNDGFEPNNSTEQAAPLGAGTIDAVLCDTSDDDYYVVERTSPGTVHASLYFSNAEGDIDFQLFDSGGQQIDSSASTSDFEEVRVDDVPAGQYYLRVFPFANSDVQPYTMEVHDTGLVTPGADAGVEDAGAPEDSGP